ncbi:MAG: hypothetical protein IPP39_05170 [Chitinophagaceae bacterium]|nr:hypothetical protein [Chitinophagaceae bacterium]
MAKLFMWEQPEVVFENDPCRGFVQANFDKYCQSIGAIAIDPKNPKIIYAATGESNDEEFCFYRRWYL